MKRVFGLLMLLLTGCTTNDPDIERYAAMILPRGHGRGEYRDQAGDTLQASRRQEFEKRRRERTAKSRAAKDADEAILRRMNTRNLGK